MLEGRETPGRHQADASGQTKIGENGGLDALTCIRGAYTLASPHEPNADEVDDPTVKHFFKTLAEVALAIGSREVGN